MARTDYLAALQFLVRCARHLAVTDPRTFALTVVGAIVLAAGCWWVCTHWARLWNLRFRATTLHHGLCAVAASLTLIFTIAYVGLGKAEALARQDIREWSAAILQDKRWDNATFAEAFNTIRRQSPAAFRGYTPPEKGGKVMPLPGRTSRQTAARVYAERACDHFRRRYPFLSRVLWADSATPAREIAADVDRWFARNPGQHYDGTKAIRLAARIIDRELARQSPRVVYLARLVALIAFVVAQAMPLLIIGWAGYRDLHEIV
jgi:hypothetical protein